MATYAEFTEQPGDRTVFINPDHVALVRPGNGGTTTLTLSFPPTTPGGVTGGPSATIIIVSGEASQVLDHLRRAR